MAASRNLFEIKAITAGKDQTLALLASGEVLGWGGPGSGRYVSPYVDICSPLKESDGQPAYIGPPDYYSDISAGFGLSLGVCKQQPFIWGFAQVGIGSRSLITEAPSEIHGLERIRKIAVGQFIFAAINEDHRLYTWGLNLDGALGRSTSQFNSLPEFITKLPPVHDVEIGDHFMLALLRDQRIYAWGSNSSGQLGLGHLTAVTSPQPIDLPAPV